MSIDRRAAARLQWIAACGLARGREINLFIFGSEELSMNKVALGVGLVLSLMSWSAVAEEQGSMREASPSIEEQCRVMAVQHGMKEDNLDAWVKKCVEISEKMQNDRGMGENDDSNDMNDNNDMQDSEEGDSDMGDDGQ
jgi:hypothetical protein